MFQKPSRIETVTEEQLFNKLVLSGRTGDEARMQVSVCRVFGSCIMIKGVGYELVEDSAPTPAKEGTQ